MSNLPTNLDLIAQNQAQKEATANAMFTAASPAMIYGRREQTSAGRVWGYYGGVLKTGGGYLTLANGTVTLVDNTDNYIEARLDTGAVVVVVGPGGFTPGRLALYKVTVAGGVATAWTDYRQALLGAAGNGAIAFTDLIDTPAKYTGKAGKVVVVNAFETGLNFVDPPAPGAVDFTDLGDAPPAYTGQAGKVVAVKGDESGLEFITAAGSGFERAFDDLNLFTGLTMSLRGGVVAIANGSVITSMGGSWSLTDDATNYFEIDPATGYFGFNNSGFTPGHTPVWKVVCAAGDIVSKTDMRPTYYAYQGQGGGGGATDFTDLGDVPASYAGQGGKAVAVKSDATGLEFVDFPTGGADQFTDLTDAPADYTGQAGKVVAVKGDESGLEFIAAGGGGGASDFTDLGDVPASYAGAGSYKVVVKSDATGLEFVPDSTGSDFDWVKISSDYTSGTAATAGADQSMAIGPGAKTVAATHASATPTSAGNFGGSPVTGYLLFATGPLPFSVGQTVELSGFPAGGPTTYGNIGLNDPGDQTTIVLNADHNFQVGNLCTVANAANPAINGDYTIIGTTTQRITLGDGFSATNSDLFGATFTSDEPTANGLHVITAVYLNQINFDDFPFNYSTIPGTPLVSSLVEGKALAIGPGASATADRSVALGNDTVADRTNTVMIGGRKLGGLLSPVEMDEAVTLQYYRNNQRFSEESRSLKGTLPATPDELKYNSIQFGQINTAMFVDGKIIAMTVADGKVSTWRYSFKVFTDGSFVPTLSAWVLEPVSVETEHADCVFEAVADPDVGGWKFVVSNTGAGTVKYNIMVRRTIAYNF